MPNVVFGTANPVVDGVAYLKCGGAKPVIGLATAPLDELLAWRLAVGRPRASAAAGSFVARTGPCALRTCCALAQGRST